MKVNKLEVDSGQDMDTNDEMLCQVETMLNSAESEDLERLHEALKSLGHVGQAGNKGVVSEVYTPPRVTALAGSLGLSPGFALDMTVIDPGDGQPWDSDVAAKREKAEKKVREEKPMLLIGSPMCRACSRLQELD